MDVLLKKTNPSKKYNKFTLAAETLISYKASDIKDMGFDIINARLINNIYCLQLYNTSRKREQAKSVFGCS